MKTVAIIQARMNSTRLPGKVLLPIGDTNAIQMIVDKCKVNSLIDEIVIATEPRSLQIIKYCKNHKIECFIGDENDVLGRVRRTAKIYQAEIVIDITSDCPFIDLTDLDFYIDLIKSYQVDYVSNIMDRTFPDGLDLQVYSFKALERLIDLVTEPENYQHSGWNFTRFQDKFKCVNIYADDELNWPDLRVTLDTAEDYAVINLIYSWLGPDTTPLQIINFMRNNPKILRINNAVKTKEPGEL